MKSSREHFLINALQAIGLHEKEIRLYLEMLAIGDQPASVLSRKLGLPRSSVQFLAETLIKKGVARKHQSRNITNYQPVPPKASFVFLRQEKMKCWQNTQRKKNFFQKLFPNSRV